MRGAGLALFTRFGPAFGLGLAGAGGCNIRCRSAEPAGSGGSSGSGGNFGSGGSCGTEPCGAASASGALYVATPAAPNAVASMRERVTAMRLKEAKKELRDCFTGVTIQNL